MTARIILPAALVLLSSLAPTGVAPGPGDLVPEGTLFDRVDCGQGALVGREANGSVEDLRCRVYAHHQPVTNILACSEGQCPHTDVALQNECPADPASGGRACVLSYCVKTVHGPAGERCDDGDFQPVKTYTLPPACADAEPSAGPDGASLVLRSASTGFTCAAVALGASDCAPAGAGLACAPASCADAAVSDEASRAACADATLAACGASLDGVGCHPLARASSDGTEHWASAEAQRVCTVEPEVVTCAASLYACTTAAPLCRSEVVRHPFLTDPAATRIASCWPPQAACGVAQISSRVLGCSGPASSRSCDVRFRVVVTTTAPLPGNCAALVFRNGPYAGCPHDGSFTATYSGVPPQGDVRVEEAMLWMNVVGVPGRHATILPPAGV